MRIEPSADMRAVAHSAREMFLSLVEKGFTEEQALQLIGITLGQAASGGGRSSDK